MANTRGKKVDPGQDLSNGKWKKLKKSRKRGERKMSRWCNKKSPKERNQFASHWNNKSRQKKSWRRRVKIKRAKKFSKNKRESEVPLKAEQKQ